MITDARTQGQPRNQMPPVAEAQKADFRVNVKTFEQQEYFSGI